MMQNIKIEYVNGVIAGHLVSGSIFGTTIPASSIKPGADCKEKQTSTITIKVDMDASAALKTIDDVSNDISKRIDTALNIAFRPGSKAWSAIKNNR
ncbi:hypothetical protein NRG04_004124 [Klebsiella aerogenes]|nr:hypothetical protein [Klebsiella aerogenes]EKU6674745.1 hypothetical protein [Klebsiella aerogenes]